MAHLSSGAEVMRYTPVRGIRGVWIVDCRKDSNNSIYFKYIVYELEIQKNLYLHFCKVAVIFLCLPVLNDSPYTIKS